MVEVGTLSIGGSIDTENIESGLSRVGKGFDVVESKSGGVNSDFERMASTGMRLNKLFLGMALAGGGAMIAIAKGAPAVAGSMAKIKVKAGELMRTLGRALAPAFEMVSDAFADFVGWIEEHSEGIGYFTTTILGGFIDALEGIQRGWTWITDNVNDFLVKIGVDWNLGDIGRYLLDHFGPEVVAGMIGAGIGSAAGFVFGGPPGAAVGAGIGFAAGAGTMYAGRRIHNPAMFLQEREMMGGLGSWFTLLSQRTIRRAIGLTLTDNV